MDKLALLAGVAFSVMWSSAFTSARMVVMDAPPFWALSCRFLVSGCLACGIAAMLGQTARMDRRQWGAVVLFGLCQNAVYLGLNFVAMQWVEASLAVIVASLLPLVVALAGRVFFGERLGLLGNAGLAAGFSGVILIMGARVSGGVDPLGLGFLFISLGALSAATLLLRDALPRGNMLMVVGLQMFVGAAALLPLAVLLEVPVVNWTPRLFLAFGYTTLFPGVAATLIWFWLVRRIGSTHAAAFHFLNPFFGVAVADLLLNESLGPRDLLGVAIVAAGILAVQLARRGQMVLPPSTSSTTPVMNSASSEQR